MPTDQEQNQLEQTLNELLDERTSISEEQLELQRKIHQLRKEIYEEGTDYLDRAEEIKRVRNEELELLENEEQFWQKKIEQIEEYYKQLSANEEIRGERKEQLEEELEALRERQQELERQNIQQEEGQKERKERLDEIYEKIEDKREQIEEIEELNDTDLDTLKEKRKQYEKILEHVQDQLEGRQRAAQLGEEQMSNLFGISEAWKESTMGAMLHAASIDDMEAQYEQWAASVQNTLTPMNILGSTVEKVQEATIAWAVTMESAESDFMKATGAGEQWNQTLNRAVDTSYSYAFSADEISQSMQTLYDEFALFNQLSEETQVALTQHTAALGKLGANQALVAENLDFLMKGFGQTQSQARATQREILNLGRELGKGSKLVDEFAQTLPELAQHGEEAIGVFEGLAEHSAETGIEIQGLMDTASQYNTFEDAAESAGRLNAMLGNDLVNSVELLQQTESERIQTLREAVSQSGQAWENMNRYRRMSIASAAGIQDMAKAERLFGENAAENQELMQDRIKSQEDLNEAAREAEPIWNRFKAAIMSLAVELEPVVNLLADAIDVFLDINQAVRQATDGWINLAAIIVGFMALGGNLGGLIRFLTLGLGKLAVTLVSSLIPGVTGLGESFGSLADDIQKTGSAAQKTAGGLLALGAAIAMAGAGIWAAAHGLSALVESFAKLTGTQIAGAVVAVGALTLAMYGMATAIAAVGTAATASAVQMGVFGAAMLAAGGGIMLAALGVSWVVESLTQLVQVAGGGELMKVAAALTMMAGAMFTMSLAGSLVVAAIPGIYALSYAIDAIPLKKAQALANLFESLTVQGAASQLSQVASSLSQLNPQIRKLISNMQNLPSSKAMSFKASLEAVGDVAEASAKLKDNSIDRVKKILKMSKQYHQIIKEQGQQNVDVDALAEAIKQIMGSTGGGEAGASGGTPEKLDISLNIDGRELRRWIIKTVGNEFSMDRKY